MVRQPYEAVGDESRSCGERVVGKHLEQVRKEAERFVETFGRGERRAVVGRCHKYDAPWFEPTCEITELLSTLDENAKDEAAARVRDNVEGGGLFWQRFEQHPGVLFGR